MRDLAPTDLQIVAARRDDLARYIELLEETADWLEARGITQWRAGSFRASSAYYAGSIARGEIQLARVGEELVGTLRVLLQEPIVWPEVALYDSVYVYNLAVRRIWSGRRLGHRLLDWAADRAASLGREFVRLDCVADSRFLAAYYVEAGFRECGEIDARFPPPVGTLRLKRYEKAVRARPSAHERETRPSQPGSGT